MKTKEQILENISSNKEIQKSIKKVSLFSNDDFYENAVRYINAVRENRIICAIGSVSRSGMSRTIKFMESSHNKETNRTNWYNFQSFFKAIGYKNSKSDYSYFTVNGCGMDMIFHTNYSIIHQLGNLEFLDKEEVQKLAQNTPPII
jgi:hypothetical protein